MEERAEQGFEVGSRTVRQFGVHRSAPRTPVSLTPASLTPVSLTPAPRAPAPRAPAPRAQSVLRTDCGGRAGHGRADNRGGTLCAPSPPAMACGTASGPSASSLGMGVSVRVEGAAPFGWRLRPTIGRRSPVCTRPPPFGAGSPTRGADRPKMRKTDISSRRPLDCQRRIKIVDGSQGAPGSLVGTAPQVYPDAVPATQEVPRDQPAAHRTDAPRPPVPRPAVAPRAHLHHRRAAHRDGRRHPAAALRDRGADLGERLAARLRERGGLHDRPLPAAPPGPQPRHLGQRRPAGDLLLRGRHRAQARVRGR